MILHPCKLAKRSRVGPDLVDIVKLSYGRKKGTAYRHKTGVRRINRGANGRIHNSVGDDYWERVEIGRHNKRRNRGGNSGKAWDFIWRGRMTKG